VPPERAQATNIRIGEDLKGPVTAIRQATVNLFADMGVQPATLRPGLVAATLSNDRTAPASRVEGSPRPLADGAFEVSGTATDRGGGVVAGVEVSIDDGRTWHPADGTSRWRYRWSGTVGAAQGNVLSRAVDDSGNLEGR
jgi:hypothetical protein